MALEKALVNQYRPVTKDRMLWGAFVKAYSSEVMDAKISGESNEDVGGGLDPNTHRRRTEFGNAVCIHCFIAARCLDIDIMLDNRPNHHRQASESESGSDLFDGCELEAGPSKGRIEDLVACRNKDQEGN